MRFQAGSSSLAPLVAIGWPRSLPSSVMTKILPLREKAIGGGGPCEISSVTFCPGVSFAPSGGSAPTTLPALTVSL